MPFCEPRGRWAILVVSTLIAYRTRGLSASIRSIISKIVLLALGGLHGLHDARAALFTTEQKRLLARQSFWLYLANEVVVGYGTSAPPADVERQRQAFLQRFPHLYGQRILLFLSRIHIQEARRPANRGFRCGGRRRPTLATGDCRPRSGGTAGRPAAACRSVGHRRSHHLARHAQR